MCKDEAKTPEHALEGQNSNPSSEPMSEAVAAAPPQAFNAWQKWDVIFKACIPIAVVLAGYFVNDALEKRKDLETIRNRESAKYAIIQPFLQTIETGSPLQKQLALDTIYTVLPQTAAASIMVAYGDINKSEASAMQSRKGLEVLSQNLFSAFRPDREDSYVGLRNAPDLQQAAKAIIAEVESTSGADRPDGIYNAMKLLARTPSSDLKAVYATDQKQMDAALDIGTSNGPNTASFVAQIKGALRIK